jgi:hypothetical protein
MKEEIFSDSDRGNSIEILKDLGNIRLREIDFELLGRVTRYGM